MKKLALFCIFFSICYSAYTAELFFEYESKNYIVNSEVSIANAKETADKLDLFLNFFNEYFHFPVKNNTAKFKVKIFRNNINYNEYLKTIKLEPREDFVFLKYNNKEKNELFCYYTDSIIFDRALGSQSFIQFLKTYVDNSPLWIQNGFSLYFRDISITNGNIIIKNNDKLLDELKDILKNNKALPIPVILNPSPADFENYKKIFAVQSWGIISFLLNTNDKKFNRIIWDSLSSIDLSGTLDGNNRKTAAAFDWTDKKEFFDAFSNYIYNTESYKDLIDKGINAYTSGMYEYSRDIFINASSKGIQSYIPNYYLGLISYNKKDFKTAETYYTEALKIDSNNAVIHYALGLNYFAAKENEKAREHLSRAKEIDPERYNSKADSLINSIKSD